MSCGLEFWKLTFVSVNSPAADVDLWISQKQTWQINFFTSFRLLFLLDTFAFVSLPSPMQPSGTPLLKKKDYLK